MRWAAWLAGVLALVLLAAGARAGPEGAEIWAFAKGDVRREVDVTGLGPDIRAALVQRLADEGYVRLGPEGPGRDLRADVEALVAHGGRFPTGATVQALEALLDRAERLVADLDEAVDGPGATERLAGVRRRLEALLAALPSPSGGAGSDGSVAFLGARLRLPGAVLLEGVPAGSFAAAAGLRAGDRVLWLDGVPPAAGPLAAWAKAPPPGAQRTLGVGRRDGRRETWEFRWEASREDARPVPAR